MMEPEEMRQLLCTLRLMVRSECDALAYTSHTINTHHECAECSRVLNRKSGCMCSNSAHQQVVASLKRLRAAVDKMDDLPINDPETTLWQRVRFCIRSKFVRQYPPPSANDLIV